MFPITPAPGSTESLRGYQLRLAERNGYPVPKWVVDTLQGTRVYSARKVLDAMPLREWAGLSDEQVASLTMLGSGRKYRLRGVDLDRRAFQLNRPKVCPQCLAEHGWCEAFGDLRLAVACPTHHVLLADRCDQCGRGLTWQRSKVSRCRCGRDLTVLPTQGAPAAVCDVMAVLRHSVYRNDDAAPLPQSMQHLHSLGLRQLHRLLSAFSVKCHGHIGDATLTEVYDSDTAAIERAAEILADWPSGLHEFLNREITPSVKQSGALPRYNSFLGWLAGLDTAGNNEDRSAFAFLDEEVRHHLVGVLANSALDRCIVNGSCASSTPVESAPHCLAAGGAKTDGTATRQCHSSSEKHHVTWSGSASSLLVMPIHTAAQQLGMSIETLRALRDMGAFNLSLRGARRTHVPRDAVNKLGETLKSWIHGAAANGDPGSPTIAQSFNRFGVLHGERAAFFVWLAGCPRLVVGCSSPNGDADSLQVDATAVERFFSGLRSRSAGAKYAAVG